jgi:acetyl-CoA carboxylase carboxyl transferase subunit alpha
MSESKLNGLDFEKPIRELEKKIKELESFTNDKQMDCSEEVVLLKEKLKKLTIEIFSNITPWQRVQLARHPKRPYSKDLIGLIFDDFVEIHGDRRFSDDKAIIAGVAKFDGRSVVVIGQQKGREIKEKIECNFGCAHPEGYRKALRAMEMAEKFKFPVIIFIDTPGAYPGVAAEERGQAEAIAYNIMRMSDLKAVTMAFVIGEGGSGGALGVGLTDMFAVLENAYYSVISPEGCSAILWKDKDKVSEAAKVLKITAKDLLDMKIIEEIVKEPLGGAHKDYKKTARNIKKIIGKYLEAFDKIDLKTILKRRDEKYRNMGKFTGDN